MEITLINRLDEAGCAERFLSTGQRGQSNRYWSPLTSAGAKGIMTLTWLSVSVIFFFLFFARPSTLPWLQWIPSRGRHYFNRLDVDRLNLMVTASESESFSLTITFCFWSSFFFGSFIFDSGCEESKAV